MTKGRVLIGLVIFLLGILFVWLYKHSPRKVEFLGHYDKIGAHRVNSIKKLESALKYFKAIELDLVYMPETDILDVNHPPASSAGLTFSTYVTALGDNQPFIWLDIKNLDGNNAEKILRKLTTILDQKGFPKHKVLIETQFPEKLDLFAFEGYKTSYYLKQNLYKLNQHDLDSEIKKIQTILKEQPALGISTEHFDYEILKQYFPEKTKYFWSLRHSKIGNYSLVRAMLEDTTVALVLTRYSPF